MMKRWQGSGEPTRRRAVVKGAVLASAMILATALTACSAGPASPSTAVSTSPAVAAVPDPDVSKIPGIDMVPSAAQVDYAGADLFVKLQKNPYAKWTPKKAPWTFCLSESMTSNTWRQNHMAELGRIVDVLVSEGLATGPLKVTDANGNTPLQLTQYQSLVDGGCDVIVVLPNSPEAMCDTIAAAAEKGVLSLTSDAAADCPAVMNVTFNGYYSMFKSAKAVADAIGGKGDVLLVTGFVGVTANAAEQAAIDNVLSFYPGIKVAGSVQGNWTPSVAQGEVAKFLATHPGKIAAVLEFGEMGVATQRAFAQAGRETPVMNAASGEKAAFAFWKNHPGSTAAAQVQAPEAAAYETLHVALRMLAGQQPALNTLIYSIPTVTEANFDEYYDSSYTESSVGYPRSPDGRAVPDSYWDPFFTGGESVNTDALLK